VVVVEAAVLLLLLLVSVLFSIKLPEVEVGRKPQTC
jgi:hypothetical protein